jgi:hypothetical protein
MTGTVTVIIGGTVTVVITPEGEIVVVVVVDVTIAVGVTVCVTVCALAENGRTNGTKADITASANPIFIEFDIFFIVIILIE